MAYAAVVSLAQILDQLLQSDHLPHDCPKYQLQSLCEKVSLLQFSLENFILVPKNKRETVRQLESQITDAIYEAQDIIETFISEQSETEETQSSSTSTSLQELPEIIEKISRITKETKEISDSIREQTGDSLSGDTRATKTSFSTKFKIVGQERDRMLVMDQIMSDASQLQVVPIMGMPGIGKTTLARTIYEDQAIENHFDIRAWVTVSADCNVRDVFLKLHASLESKDQKSDNSGSMKNFGDMVNQERSDFAMYFYQKLFNVRYLIVLDDVWDQRVWDVVRQYFPDNNNGSRIVLTTRMRDIADYVVKPSDFRHEMCLLDLESSWIILREMAFEEGCPPNLEKIGRSISENCQGLPLSLTVVGGLLAQKRTEEYWKIVEEDTRYAAAKSEESYLDILSLSYHHLPNRLRGCFLYMGAFPEDSEILVSKLIKLWVAEGFVAPQPHKSLELVARQYLEDIVARNLISVRRHTSSGQIKTCTVHDIIRDLAVKESGKVNFFHAINRYVHEFPEATRSRRRLSVHKNILLCVEEVYNSAKSLTLARTLLCAGPHHHHPLPYSLTFNLLRVLDAVTIYFIEFPNEVIKFIHLRYLSFTYNGKLPSSISKLENLQILIVRQYPKIIFIGTSILPDEIWNMSQLRHLLFTESEVPLIPSVAGHSVLLGNLQTLSNVNASCCTKEVLQNMPNLKKLGIWVEAPGAVNFYVDVLEQLEALTFTVLNPNPNADIKFLPTLVFPITLKKLSLSGCGIPWEEMTVIAELPHLQVLKLRELAFKGKIWILDGMIFWELKFLLLEYLDLQCWGTDDYDEARCFPSLERLIIRHCYEMDEIPEDIGNIGGLELIELVDCSPSAVESANKIREEQKDYRDDFQVRIYSSWE